MNAKKVQNGNTKEEFLRNEPWVEYLQKRFIGNIDDVGNMMEKNWSRFLSESSMSQYPTKKEARFLSLYYWQQKFQQMVVYQQNTTTLTSQAKTFKLEQQKLNHTLVALKKHLEWRYKQILRTALPPRLFTLLNHNHHTTFLICSIVQALNLFQDYWKDICNDLSNGTLSPRITLPCIRKSVITEKDLQLAVEKGSQPLVKAGAELVDFTSHANIKNQPPPSGQLRKSVLEIKSEASEEITTVHSVKQGDPMQHLWITATLSQK
ncbi:indole-3-acetic acid-amido synthetase GH3.10 [Tanacetum coccineum]